MSEALDLLRRRVRETHHRMEEANRALFKAEDEWHAACLELERAEEPRPVTDKQTP